MSYNNKINSVYWINSEKSNSRAWEIVKIFSGVVISVLILQWWENIIKPRKALAEYDVLAEICNQRMEKRAEFDRMVDRMDLNARDKQSVIENLKLIYEDYARMKKTGRINTIRVSRYYDYLNNHLKNAKSYLDRKTYESYIQMREDMQ